MTEFRFGRPLRLSATGSATVSGSFTAGSSTPVANAFTLSGPTTGITSTASTFTVTPNGQMASTVVVTPLATNAGSVVPLTLTFAAGATAAQTFTVVRTTDGTSIVSITNNGGLTNAGTPISYTTTAASSGTLSTFFTLTSPSTIAAAPFTIGHAFIEGQVPTGTGVAVTGATAQVTPSTLWPNGSLKHAIIAGTANLTANVAATISLASGTSSNGTALTTTDFKNAMAGQTCSINCGAFGLASWATTDFDSPFETWVSGHRMSNWIYRKAVGSDPHLVAWIDVRLYAGGAVEVFPWVENTSMFVSGQTNKLATYTFTLGGTQRFSQSIDIKHHARVPLLNTSTGQGSAASFSHWLGTDPAVVPAHSMPYLASTGLVPNYGYTDPVEGTLAAINVHYTPNSTYGITGYGAGGGQPGLLGSDLTQVDIHYCKTADARAYKGVMAFGLSSGSWSLHYRDESAAGAKQHQPIDLLDYATRGLFTGAPDILDGGSGGELAELTGFQSWENHGYLAYVLSGRPWFLDEQMFWQTYRYLWHSPSNRETTAMITPGSSTRERAWHLRDLTYILSALPATHPLRPSYVTAFENNVLKFYDRVVTGARDGGKYLNNALGVVDLDPALYPPNYTTRGTNAWATYWQISGLTQVISQAWNLGLPQSATSRTRHQTVRDFSYKHPVGLAGPGGTGNWVWRQFGLYVLPYGINSSTGTDWTALHPSWGSVLAEYQLRVPAGNPATTPANAPLVDNDGTTAIVGTASPYGTSFMASLAYAVEHGYAGAAAGWNRIFAASNSSVIDATNNQVGYTQFSITPRSGLALPTYLANKALLEWVALTGPGSTSGIEPAGFPGTYNVVNAWGGGAMRQSTAQLILNGGGHGDYDGNEIYACNLLANSPAWSRIWGPTPKGQVTATPYYADGNPSSAHTYYYLHWDEANDRLLQVKGGPGYTISGTTNEFTSWPYGGANWNPQGTHPDINVDGYAPCTARDPVSGHVLAWGGFYRSRWNPASNTWILNGDTSVNRSFGERASCIDTLRNRMVIFGDSGEVASWALSNNAFTTSTATGTPAFAAQMGAAYDPVNDCIWYVGTDSILRKYDCTTGVCSVASTTGTGPLDVNNYGTNKGYFGRLQYSTLLRAVVLQPAWAASTFVIRTSA